MATEILMPKLGLTMLEGTIEQWKKNEGDTISKGDILFSVATDKLTNDVEADEDGVLLKIVVAQGETVPCKSVVAYVGAAGEAAPTGATQAAAPEKAAEVKTEAKPVESATSASAPVRAAGEYVTATPYAKKLANERGIDLANVKGTGVRGMAVAKDLDGVSATAAKGVKASPLAEKIAADIGVELDKIGTKGRVLAQDILAYLKGGSAPTETVQSEETVPMSGMRKAIAKNMSYSAQTSPTVSFNLAIDMSQARAYREQLKANGVKVSYTDLIVKFVAKALTEYPDLNCSVDGDSIIYKNYVNVGVAVALEGGLMVPNVPNADKKTLSEISAEIREFADAARSGGISPDRLRGGTFTITNLGMYGIDSFTPIINQPEVAILGINTMEDKVVVRDGEMVIRPMMNISLTADHRVVDGAVAAEFMQRIKTLMENPALMLA